uniref:Uncharacterized protein n=1 Tax=Arundo donax TaxID=35708 RepID=A0A0A9GYY7_ARUDO
MPFCSCRITPRYPSRRLLAAVAEQGGSYSRDLSRYGTGDSQRLRPLEDDPTPDQELAELIYGHRRPRRQTLAHRSPPVLCAHARETGRGQVRTG